jgi:hypothetical protein
VSVTVSARSASEGNGPRSSVFRIPKLPARVGTRPPEMEPPLGVIAVSVVSANIAETPIRPIRRHDLSPPAIHTRSRALSDAGDVGIVGADGVAPLALRHIHGILPIHNAPVAQLDRVCDFGSQGCRFEPCRVQAFSANDLRIYRALGAVEDMTSPYLVSRCTRVPTTTACTL